MPPRPSPHGPRGVGEYIVTRATASDGGRAGRPGPGRGNAPARRGAGQLGAEDLLAEPLLPDPGIEVLEGDGHVEERSDKDQDDGVEDEEPDEQPGGRPRP